MKHIAFVVFALSLCAVPIWAGTSMSDDARSSASNIQTFSENYFYAASSPVDIQLPGFTLIADSGSLKYEIEINVSKLPYKDGTWKHGQGKLTNDQKQYLKQNGWNIE